MDQQQQEALKRMFDQAMEQTRRSLEAVDLHSKNLIDNELILIYSALDLKNLTDTLVNDQEMLFKYLCDLKATKDKTKEIIYQINQLEEDLELRGDQIIEMSSKQEDLDTKVKKLSESFKTIPELRTAVVHVINKLLDTRNDFKAQLKKAEDQIDQLQAENANLKNNKPKTETPKENKKRKKVIESIDEEIPEDPKLCKSEDENKDPDYSPHSQKVQVGMKKFKVSCSCKTNCLKKFCICKKYGNYCIDCSCKNCLNTEAKKKVQAENEYEEEEEPKDDE